MIRTPIVKNIAAQAVTAGTAVAVWTPATGSRYVLLGYALSLSVAGEVLFKEQTSGSEFLRTPALLASTPFADHFPDRALTAGAINHALAIDASASGTVNGYVYGYEEVG